MQNLAVNLCLILLVTNAVSLVGWIFKKRTCPLCEHCNRKDIT